MASISSVVRSSSGPDGSPLASGLETKKESLGRLDLPAGPVLCVEFRVINSPASTGQCHPACPFPC